MTKPGEKTIDRACEDFIYSYHAVQMNDYSICTEDSEICVIRFNMNQRKIIVIGVYRPPQGSKINFIQDLDAILSDLDINSSTVFVTGDFNINLSRSDDPITVDLSSKLFSRFFLPLIDKPTRFPGGNLNSMPSTIDMIWTNSLNVVHCGIIDHNQTDGSLFHR